VCSLVEALCAPFGVSREVRSGSRPVHAYPRDRGDAVFASLSQARMRSVAPLACLFPAADSCIQTAERGSEKAPIWE
jgi:hypothetical protein